MKNILVTGGAGFIGSHLVDSLLKDGQHRVVVVDNFDNYYNKEIKLRNIKSHLLHDNYTLIEEDIRNREAIEQIVAEYDPEVIVHLAARAGVRPSLQDPKGYVEVNINGTVNLLDAAVKHKVSKFVFGSSSSVYGLNQKVPFAEVDPTLLIASPYGATKAAGESLCHSYSNCFDISIVALRFFTVFGPRQRPDLAIHNFSKRILNEEPISLFGDGTSSRDYTFVDDIVSGIRKSIELEISGYQVFNLGNDQPTGLLELVQILEENLGKKAIIDWKPMQVGDVPKTWADIQKSRELLGYSPSTSFQQGIAEFAKWVKAEYEIVIK
ncbi:SDR family NAD(P)-dependent oxidoreductase [Paenibacillus sp. SI8]|uniref:SDR family NAD(P)-dependent oxidoreductase n=1 Tax=unclassified Paenibacillus TaxID=185978 RepID=UPI003466E138